MSDTNTPPAEPAAETHTTEPAAAPATEAAAAPATQGAAAPANESATTPATGAGDSQPSPVEIITWAPL